MAHGGQADARPSVFHEILYGTALYSTALFGQRIVSVALFPLNTRYLTPTDYGVLELLEQVGIVLSLLLCVNLSAALGYFYFQKDSVDDRRRVVSTTIVSAVLIGTVACVGGILFVGPIGRLVFAQSSYGLYLVIVFASLPLSFALEAEFVWLRVANLPGMFAKASLLRAGVTVLGVVVLVAGLKLGVLGVLSGSYSAILAVFLLLSVYCFRRIPPVFDRPLFFRMLRFAIPLGVSTLALFVINFGDRFILPRYRPLSELGIYGIACKIGMLMSLIYGSFHTYWTAQIFEIARREDAEAVIARVFTYLMLALSFCGLGLVVFSRPAVGILTTPSFQYAAMLVPTIVLAYYLRAIGDFFRCFFLVQGCPEYDAVCNWAGAGVCLGGYFLLIPRIGVWGAAIATAGTFFVVGVVSLIWTYRLKPYRLDGVRLLKIAGVTAALAGLYFAVPVDFLPVQIAWGALLLLAYPALLWLVRFPREGEMLAGWRALGEIAGRLRSRTARAMAPGS